MRDKRSALRYLSFDEPGLVGRHSLTPLLPHFASEEFAEMESIWLEEIEIDKVNIDCRCFSESASNFKLILATQQ